MVKDSLQLRLDVLSTLAQAGNFEQAQVEAESFKSFLSRYKLAIPAVSISVLSNIYQANKDSASALGLLAAAERDARLDPDYNNRAAMYSQIAAAYERWRQPARAIATMRSLAIVKDTLAARATIEYAAMLQHQVDSLQALRLAEGYGNPDIVKMSKRDALLMAGAVALLLLLLIVAIFRTGSKWRKKLLQRELEMEIERANDKLAYEQMLASAVVSAPVASKSVADPLEFAPDNVGSPDKIALLIEPNRQVVIYLKSLLSDRFRVETAFTANEGMQRAADLLPDLIVCDAVLNGKTGIDVARQIKLSERTNHIPVILLSDRFGNEGKLDALRAGAEAWFTRPVLDDEFGATVSRLLDARKDNHDRFARVLHLWFTDHREALDNRFLGQTMQLIEQNLSDPDFMADDLARKMQLPRHHFVKKLGVLTGKEPVQLIREMRLEKAKILLEKRAGTPQAIAELVGFSNPGTFALAFKEYFGENTLLLNNPPPRLSS
ncbi:MAG: response regulator transcription factor [Saprospiraceae bacterium]